MSSAAAILGCAGPELSQEERDFFREVRPWGFILFARNIKTAEQTRELTQALREAAGDADALVFVDQEGGRVQRLKPPLARLRRPAQAFGALNANDEGAAEEAVQLNHRLIAHELAALGFDADCAPCLDLRLPETHAVIGDRSFGQDPAVVSALGREEFARQVEAEWEKIGPDGDVPDTEIARIRGSFAPKTFDVLVNRSEAYEAALATARCSTTGASGSSGKIFVATNASARRSPSASPRRRSLRPKP